MRRGIKRSRTGRKLFVRRPRTMRRKRRFGKRRGGITAMVNAGMKNLAETKYVTNGDKTPLLYYVPTASKSLKFQYVYEFTRYPNMGTALEDRTGISIQNVKVWAQLSITYKSLYAPNMFPIIKVRVIVFTLRNVSDDPSSVDTVEFWDLRQNQCDYSVNIINREKCNVHYDKTFTMKQNTYNPIINSTSDRSTWNMVKVNINMPIAKHVYFNGTTTQPKKVINNRYIAMIPIIPVTPQVDSFELGDVNLVTRLYYQDF